MSLWRIARDEVAGACRSVRYDLRRRSDADRRRTADSDADTGLQTFGFALHDTHDDDVARSPRHLIAASAFGLLAVIGAVGSYFAVVNGLGTLLTEPSRPSALPLVAEAGPAPAATGRRNPTSRLGHSTSIAPTPPRPAPHAAPRRTRTLTAPRTTAPTTASTTAEAIRTPVAPEPPCRCTPPTATATATATIPPDAQPSGWPSPWPSISGLPSPSVSANPSPSPSTDGYHRGLLPLREKAIGMTSASTYSRPSTPSTMSNAA